MRYPLNYIGITQTFHYGKGIDFGWNQNYGGSSVPIYSIDEGVVISIEAQPKSGNIVYIEHKNGWVSSYSHLSKIDVKKNQIVALGEKIGNMGNTGEASGPHLHLAIYSSKEKMYSESDINPLEILYVYPNQIVSAKTDKNYKLLRISEDSNNKITADKLNLRSNPSTSSNIIALLSKGTKVEVLESSGSWAKVKVEGYVSQNYLK